MSRPLTENAIPLLFVGQPIWKSEIWLQIQEVSIETQRLVLSDGVFSMLASYCFNSIPMNKLEPGQLFCLNSYQTNGVTTDGEVILRITSGFSLADQKYPVQASIKINKDNCPIPVSKMKSLAKFASTCAVGDWTEILNSSSKIWQLSRINRIADDDSTITVCFCPNFHKKETDSQCRKEMTTPVIATYFQPRGMYICSPLILPHNQVEFFYKQIGERQIQTAEEKEEEDLPKFQQDMKDLTCSICSCVLKKPVQTNCGHSYCFDCIQTWRSNTSSNSSNKCPECRADISQTLFIDARLQRTIHNVSVACSLAEECNWAGSFVEFTKNHQSSCPFVKQDCPHYGCTKQMIRSKMQKHVLKCDWKPVQCDYCSCWTQKHYVETHRIHCPLQLEPCRQGCGEQKVLRCEQIEHINKACPQTIKPCENHIRGCSFRGKFDERSSHEFQCELHLGSCPYCDDRIVVNETERHFALYCCSYPVDCVRCGAKEIPRNDLSEHNQCWCFVFACSVRDCPFAEKNLSKQELTKHNKENMVEHLAFLQNRIALLESSIWQRRKIKKKNRRKQRAAQSKVLKRH